MLAGEGSCKHTQLLTGIWISIPLSLSHVLKKALVCKVAKLLSQRDQ